MDLSLMTECSDDQLRKTVDSSIKNWPFDKHGPSKRSMTVGITFTGMYVGNQPRIGGSNLVESQFKEAWTELAELSPEVRGNVCWSLIQVRLQKASTNP